MNPFEKVDIGQTGVQVTRLGLGGAPLSGILARDLDQPVSFEYQPAPAHIVDQARKLKAVCDRHAVELKAAALQFFFAHAAVVTVVPGAATIEELEDNVRVMQVDIHPDLWSEIKHEGLLPQETPTP